MCTATHKHTQTLKYKHSCMHSHPQRHSRTLVLNRVCSKPQLLTKTAPQPGPLRPTLLCPPLLTLICPCCDSGLPPQRWAGTRHDSPLLCPVLLLLPPFALLFPFLPSPRQPPANQLSKGRQGEPATEVKFISCHSLPLNAARGIITSGHHLSP